MNDNNAILKLSNKKNGMAKPSPKHMVQTQLIDSINQKVEIDQDIQDIQNQSNQRSLSEGPQSQSKINAIIYNQPYEPEAPNDIIGVANINDVDSQNVPVVNMLQNVGSTPLDFDCPYCNNHIQSNVDSSCNCFTCFLYALMIIVFPIMCIASIYKAGTGTSTCLCCTGSGSCFDCCNDVRHICPNCGKVIAESDSCSRIFLCAE